MIVRMHYYPRTRLVTVSEDRGYEGNVPVGSTTLGPNAKMGDLRSYVSALGYELTGRQKYLSGGQCWVYILKAN